MKLSKNSVSKSKRFHTNYHQEKLRFRPLNLSNINRLRSKSLKFAKAGLELCRRRGVGLDRYNRNNRSTNESNCYMSLLIMPIR